PAATTTDIRTHRLNHENESIRRLKRGIPQPELKERAERVIGAQPDLVIAEGRPSRASGGRRQFQHLAVACGDYLCRFIEVQRRDGRKVRIDERRLLSPYRRTQRTPKQTENDKKTTE